jgi:hypothetical protein
MSKRRRGGTALDALAGSPGPSGGRSSPYVELGSTGLSNVGGFVRADFLPQLVGRQGILAYQEMENNDALIGGILYAMQMLIRSGEWTIEPNELATKAAGPGGKISPAAQNAVDFMRDALFESMDHPFDELITDALTMLPYGFAPCESVLKKLPASNLGPARIGFKSVRLRAQDTLYKWEFDPESGDLLGMWQQDFQNPVAYIPYDRLALFRTNSSRGNPEGRSVLRNSYKYYKRKGAIEEAEGRAALRSAGLVVMRVPWSIMNPTAGQIERNIFAQLKTALASIAEDRQGAVILPSDPYEGQQGKRGGYQYDIDYKVADGRRSADMSTLVERMDKRIAGSVLADFILIGQQAAGSYAMHGDKTEMFTNALGGYNRVIEAELNRRTIRRWWHLNGLPDELRPRLKPKKLSKEQLEKIGAFVGQLAAAGMLPPDKALSNRLLGMAELPPSEVPLPPPRSATPPPGRPNALTGTDPDDEEHADA